MNALLFCIVAHKGGQGLSAKCHLCRTKPPSVILSAAKNLSCWHSPYVERQHHSPYRSTASRCQHLRFFATLRMTGATFILLLPTRNSLALVSEGDFATSQPVALATGRPCGATPGWQARLRHNLIPPNPQLNCFKRCTPLPLLLHYIRRGCCSVHHIRTT